MLSKHSHSCWLSYIQANNLSWENSRGSFCRTESQISKSTIKTEIKTLPVIAITSEAWKTNSRKVFISHHTWGNQACVNNTIGLLLERMKDWEAWEKEAMGPQNTCISHLSCLPGSEICLAFIGSFRLASSDSSVLWRVGCKWDCRFFCLNTPLSAWGQRSTRPSIPVLGGVV